MSEDRFHSDVPDPLRVQHELDELEEVHYPVDKEELIDAARRHGLDDSVMAMLEEVPDGEIIDPVSISSGGGTIK